MPRLRLLQHHHSFQPYELLDDDFHRLVDISPRVDTPGNRAARPDDSQGTRSGEQPRREGGSLQPDSTPGESSIYYVGYRCTECGEQGYRVP